jgi:hypothetical protein
MTKQTKQQRIDELEAKVNNLSRELRVSNNASDKFMCGDDSFFIDCDGDLTHVNHNCEYGSTTIIMGRNLQEFLAWLENKLATTN